MTQEKGSSVFRKLSCSLLDFSTLSYFCILTKNMIFGNDKFIVPLLSVFHYGKNARI